MKWAALCALALALCGGVALAEPPRPPHDERDRPGIERLLERNAERLHLDDATRDEIRALAEAGRERSQPQREALRQLRDELHTLLEADAPDANAVMEKAEAIGRAETELQKERLRTMLAIRALLSSEQRGELVRIHEEFRERCRESGGREPGCWREHRGRE